MEKLSMSKIKEVLRLSHEAQLPARQIARALNVSHTVVNDYLKRFKDSKLEYGDVATLDERSLKDKLFGPKRKAARYPLPDWADVHTQLRFKHVTLELLHEEYAQSCPEGHYGYTWFCTHYRRYAKQVAPSMRQIHKAGEKVFIDFSGLRLSYSDPLSGEVLFAEIFVAVLGASGYPFVRALPSQKKADFIAAHIAMFRDFGGVPALLVPDNLKSAVTRFDYYEPDLNRDYEKMAEYYGCAIMPARPRKPKDKALVENGVKLTQRWILARLRHRQFFSLAEINRAIEELMPLYRNKVMKHLGKSRQELFETLDKPALKPLPAKEYEYREPKLLKVSIDYHIALEHSFYSVPYQLVGQRVEVWYSATTVYIHFEGREITSHPRLFRRGAYSTKKEHMSSAHRKYLEWSPGRLIDWGATIGASTAELLKTLMERRPHPEMGYRSCLGVMQAFNKERNRPDGLSEEALDAVAAQALRTGQFRLKQIKALLKSPPETESETVLEALSSHANLRGSDYYRPGEA